MSSPVPPPSSPAHDRAWKHSLDLQLIIGPEGSILAANEAWRDVLGWAPEEVVGQHFTRFTHPEDLALTEEAVRTARDAPLRRFEKRCLHKTDGCRWVAWVAVPEEDSVYASGRDVTQEREQASALAAMERQLRQSQKMEAIGQLTGGLAHDFNNYLGVIQNSLAALRELVDDAIADRAQTEASLERGERAAAQAASLTQRLLSFARDRPLRPEAIDLRRLLPECSQLIRSSLPPSIDFELRLPGTARCMALVDANLLDNALLNLCLNARDAMPQGGRLSVTAAERSLDAAAAAALGLPAGRYACIEVADEGLGMTEAVRSRIFEPFFTTKPSGQGTGLGLAMVYAFARRSQGLVTADSEPGAGTSMRLYLPAAVD